MYYRRFEGLGQWEALFGGAGGYLIEKLKRVWGKPESWYMALSDLQNAVIKTGAEVGGVPASDWDKVEKYFNAQLSARNPMVTGFKTFMKGHANLMNLQRVALKRLVLTETRLPSESDIAMSKMDLKILEQNVAKFNYVGPILLGDRYVEIVRIRDGLKDVVARNLENSTFQSPEERAVKAGIDDLKKRFTGGLVIGGLGLAAIAVVAGLYFLKK